MTIREAGIRATTHGAEPTRLTVSIAEYGRRDRLRRAVRRFLPIFAAGCVLFLIPPHVVWLLGFSFVGSILATQRYNEVHEYLSLTGPCPGCSGEQKLEPPMKLPAIQRCPGCGAFLKLEEL